MKKIETTYKEFYELMKHNPDKKYYVKTHKNEYSEIYGVVEKESEMLSINISGNYPLVCSKEHVFMDKSGDVIYAKDLKINTRIKSLKGDLPITSIKKSNITTCYDLAIDNPHWYINDDYGIIHHNTSFSLLMAKSYLDKYPDSAIILFDSEFGATLDMFKSFGIDLNRVLHVPITTIEELKYEVVNQLNALERGEKVFFLIDSIGNLPSEKETQNAEDGKNTADLTRNRELKSFYRLTTTKLAMKDIPMVVIAHSYKTLELYSKDVVSVGTGGYYASNIIIIVSRSQDKDGTDLVGYTFKLNIEKSRFVKEKSVIPISVSFENGISKWSGLMELALEAGVVVKPSNGWYSKVDLETGEVEEKKYRLKDTDNKLFWNDILESGKFKNYIINRYKLSSNSTMVGDVDEVPDETISEVFSEEED